MNFTEQEQNYYELIIDILDDGDIKESERALLNKRKSKYGISDERAKEIENFAFQEIQNKNKPKFNTEGEEEYYELLEDMLEAGIIDESGRNLLNKRKVKYNVSDERAKEFEDYIRSVKGINDTVSNSSNEENAKDLLEQGKLYYNDGNYVEAIRCLEKAVELEPNDQSNWNWLGNSYNKNGNYVEAIRCLEKAVELEPNDQSNWHWLGASYNKNGNYVEAIRCLNKAVELNSNDANNWHWLGASYNKNGNYEEAIRCLNKAVELNPNNSSNWYWLGRSYNQNGNYEEAIRCLEKAVELAPNDWINWNWLGSSYNQNGNYVEAIRCLEKAVELEPNDQSNWNWLGNSYNKNGNYVEAIRCLNKAVELNPNDANNWDWLGDSYNKNGQFKEAQNAYGMALEIEPNNNYYKERFQLNKDNIDKKNNIDNHINQIKEAFNKYKLGRLNKKNILAFILRLNLISILYCI